MYFFSPSICAFFFEPFREDYEKSGTWPEDAYLVSEAVHSEFSDLPPKGFKLGSLDRDPCWVEDTHTREEQKSISETRIRNELNWARQEIDLITYAKELGMSTQQEEQLLTELKRYAVLLWRVPKQTGYPLDTDWPTRPVSL